MASATTVLAFLHRGTWSETSRKHPAIKWMEAFTKSFDTHGPSIEWFTADASLQQTNDSEFYGRDQSMAATKELFTPLTSHLHDPYFLMCTETDDGYEMLCQANLFANLPGMPATGESKVEDQSGTEWDMKVPAAFHFWFVNDEKAENGLGMAIKRTELMKRTNGNHVEERINLTKGPGAMIAC